MVVTGEEELTNTGVRGMSIGMLLLLGLVVAVVAVVATGRRGGAGVIELWESEDDSTPKSSLKRASEATEYVLLSWKGLELKALVLVLASVLVLLEEWW